MQQAIEISARLYECRDTAKLLLGEKFAQEMAECGQMLQEVADRKSITVLEAAKAAAENSQKKGDSPMVTLFMMAAAVELLQPSNADGKAALKASDGAKRNEP